MTKKVSTTKTKVVKKASITKKEASKPTKTVKAIEKVKKQEFAVIEVSGNQYLVESGKEYTVKKLIGDKGSKYVCENVLLYVLEGNVKIGKPYLKEIKVEGEIVSQKKDVKVNTFRYTAKSRFRKRVGSRALITKLLIKKFVTATK